MSRSLAELEDAVRALLAWSEASGVPMRIIGGVAVSILSKPRTTRDVDVVAWLPNHSEWPVFLADGERHGIVPRIPDALGFALNSRVLLLRHDRSGVPIDLSMGPCRSRRTRFVAQSPRIWAVCAFRFQCPRISSS
ncbi:hypothetical protein WME95_24220 [Sorangium sp. So ce327]|jgi:hypothetical protein|uniref:hypothetical protein n=1 Tax=Sorangium sp. So ce327 TaxID=3133301 RepID=UPI003F5F19AA